MQPHFTRSPYFPENLDDYAPWVAKHGLLAPYGKCQCGCGSDAPIARKTEIRRGHRAGQPKQFLKGHRIYRVESVPPIEECPPDTRLIPLSKGKYAIVDAADFEWLMQWKWHAEKDRNGNWYARHSVCENGKYGKVHMHRLVANVSDDTMPDHINGNTLDNRRQNLRQATNKQNSRNQRKSRANTSGFKGVTLHRETGKWRAQIRIDGKMRHLGLFDEAREAAIAYNEAAIAHYGEFARINDLAMKQEMAALGIDTE